MEPVQDLGHVGAAEAGGVEQWREQGGRLAAPEVPGLADVPFVGGVAQPLGDHQRAVPVLAALDRRPGRGLLAEGVKQPRPAQRAAARQRGLEHVGLGGEHDGGAVVLEQPGDDPARGFPRPGGSDEGGLADLAATPSESDARFARIVRTWPLCLSLTEGHPG